MKIAIAGGSGFIGRAITEELRAHKHDICILTRNPDKHKPAQGIRYIRWLQKDAHPEKELEGIDAFINLAGESLNSGRWTQKRKREIVESRIETAAEMTKILSLLEKKPECVINASAIGYYPVSESSTYTEKETKSGDGFLARTVVLWEKEAKKAKAYCGRMVIARFGVILGMDAGALPSIIMPYKVFAGGTIGSGRQWLSWIHIHDAARAIHYCLQNESISGPINLTAPAPVRMKEFGQTAGEVLHRPHWLPVPSIALKTVMGEMSSMVLEGQCVMPDVLLSHSFTFDYPLLKGALEQLLDK
jgi:uncharacterized protein